jgi:hypothetical protein
MTQTTSCLAEPHVCFAELVQRALRVEPSPHAGWARSTADLARVRDEVESLVADAIGLTWDVGELAPDGAAAREVARFATRELRAILGGLVAASTTGDGAVADEERLAGALEARDRVVDIGLAFEQELAGLRGVPSRLNATRHVVNRRMRRRNANRAALASEIEAATGDPRVPWAARARRVAALLSRALYAASGQSLRVEERRVVRQLCERVIALVWATAADERDEAAREIVHDASTFATLLVHMSSASASPAGPAWPSAAA